MIENGSITIVSYRKLQYTVLTRRAVQYRPGRAEGRMHGRESYDKTKTYHIEYEGIFTCCE
ncbi:hypothetical protein CE91St56_38840 [Lachnospiraceae bacterium]|nr:hypothetical protein CE91St56_38840 [Lachnospiraceae bacterium]GKH42835.1 hypothetical protein CE91St57_38090 [Lachnospiraceae bacterium]